PAGDRLLRRRGTELVPDEGDREDGHAQAEHSDEDACRLERGERPGVRRLDVTVVGRAVAPQVDGGEEEERPEAGGGLAEGDVRVLEPVAAERPRHRGVEAEGEEEQPGDAEERRPALALHAFLADEGRDELREPEEPRPRRDGDEL